MRALLTSLWILLLVGAAVADPAKGEYNEVVEACAKRVAKLSGEMMSPICRGKTLQSCTSPGAQQIRLEMQRMCMAGASNDKLIKVMDDRYGARMRAEFGYDLVNPEQPWYSAFLPMIPFAIGALILGVVLWQWRRRGAKAPPSRTSEEAPAVEGADADRLARLRQQVESEED